MLSWTQTTNHALFSLCRNIKPERNVFLPGPDAIAWVAPSHGPVTDWQLHTCGACTSFRSFLSDTLHLLQYVRTHCGTSAHVLALMTPTIQFSDPTGCT